MELLRGKYTLDTPVGTFPLGTDSMLLADFVRLPRSARVLDLGSGCAALGLLLCAGDDSCHVTGVEIDDCSHNAAVANIARNKLEDRMESIHADLRTVSFVSGSFDTVLSNPPYFAGGPKSAQGAKRREDTCSLGDLFACAQRALRFGGDLFLVHRPERLGELIAAGSRFGLELKRLCCVRHKPDSPVNLLLLSFRKGGKPGVIWEDLNLCNADGSPSPDTVRIYSL